MYQTVKIKVNRHTNINLLMKLFSINQFIFIFPVFQLFFHSYNKNDLDDLEEMAPEFEPVFTNVYQYYGNSLISFTNIIDDLLLQLPILIKLMVLVPMSLFSIETAPVPLDAETHLGEKREYTQIIPETELIVLTENNYIPLTQAQISLCRNTPEARDSYFTTYYSFNKIVLDIITEKFDIQVDKNTRNQAALLHDDIPGYDLPTINFVQTITDNDEDISILEEDNLQIYAHLDNVLVHMIDNQQTAIFKLNEDFNRNKEKISQYI